MTMHSLRILAWFVVLLPSCGESRLQSAEVITSPETENYSGNEADGSQGKSPPDLSKNSIDSDLKKRDKSVDERDSVSSDFSVYRICSNRLTSEIGTNLVSSTAGVALVLHGGDDPIVINEVPQIRERVMNESRFSLNFVDLNVPDGNYRGLICDRRFMDNCRSASATSQSKGVIGAIEHLSIVEGKAESAPQIRMITNANIKDTLMRQSFMNAFTGVLSGQAQNPASFFNSFAQVNAINLMDKPQECDAQSSPLLIDLTGNGLHLSAPLSGVLFDIDAIGTKSQISWSKTAGILVLDRNGDGSINDGSELFGTATKGGFANGFLALAALDDNHDRRIDQKDPAFATLQVWIDSNLDGQSHKAELQSLEAAGIVSIPVAYTDTADHDKYGNSVRQAASVTMRKAERRPILDVWFRTVDPLPPATQRTAH